MRRVMLAAAIGAGGCGDDVVGPASPLQPLCGQDGPVAWVDLAEDEEVEWMWPYGDDHGSIVASVGEIGPPPSGELAEELRRVVVDPCGDELGRLTLRLWSVWTQQDRVLGCSLDYDLLHLTSIDDPQPRVIARGSCFSREVSGVIVAVDAEPAATEGRLVSIVPTPDGVETTTLLEGVRRDIDGTTASPIHAVDDRMFAQLDADGSVRSLDPSTGQSQTELGPVHTFVPRSHAIAFRPSMPAEATTGPLLVRMRASGDDIELAGDVPVDASVLWTSDVLLWAEGRRFLLDPPHEIVPPDGTDIVAVRDDGLVWLRRLHERSWGAQFLQWREGQSPVVILDCEGCWLTWPTPGHDAIWVGREAAELWRLDDDGSEPRRVATPVDDHYEVLDDGRVLTVDGGWYGPLLSFDGHGGPASTIADEVGRLAPHFSAMYGAPTDLVYEARHPDGTGALYRARLR